MDALQIIVELARDTLNPNTLEEAENIAQHLVGTYREHQYARIELMKLVASPPKRPLYYLQHEIQFLPRWTRDAIRYSGDYVDLLVKEMVFELSGDHRVREYSMGKNINILKSKKYRIPEKLIVNLGRHNSFIYRPGKHDFNVPEGRGHRFTSREAVLTAFVTMELANEIKSLSKLAKEASSK